MAQSTTILDDAHALGPEELAYLLRIISPPCGVRIANRMVLFGEPSLNTNLSALIQDLPDATAVSSVYLPAMTPDEPAAYLRQRLSAAGLNDRGSAMARVADVTQDATPLEGAVISQEYLGSIGR